ncbi:BREX-2 system adenine-specific DNA-methyltransferase PglX [Demequina muriae]|uniref:site-specific DNA-methyltransferase (adenine-specific) n=1 Tax=Demequina muriae TaxID=3051664 RepID=A0ABT8GE50_9MICO|nr:BREX-2 system adenine-specific DNA-methyltransferase PglX [Demequina sp. EGI L300058]MDN4479711.1 BREX-2 system adenine-specific DNA-methyltransferase PglX [Demequina sp. EGI L300058]
MSAQSSLTAELRAEVTALEDDLRSRVAAQPDVDAEWREQYRQAISAERTSASWEAWRDERVTLAAVSWVLTTVFVRFCEDNGLVSPVWIAGPRSSEAVERQSHFIRDKASAGEDVTDREWILDAVAHLSSLEATRELVDANAPMWLVAPSGDAATRLLAFWRERDEDGTQRRDLVDPLLDTRFLGDLYQDISEAARERYALLQTPDFVEEFILDHTLEPALAERPLDGFRMIDPTCGSGHFLLGAFALLLDRWHREAPGLDERERVQRALDAIHGVDINPYAVAIARFRLTVSALQACGMTSLETAPAFRYHLAAGDSLLHGGAADAYSLDLGAAHTSDRVAAEHAYATENLGVLREILADGRYDAVVGNPPYISVKDAKLRNVYRARYSSCKGKYVLTVPFMEKFFSLAKTGDSPGWVGQITSNSFMKREFGSKLIEWFLPKQDLRLVVDTSGAYIPGHGTPTVIIVGRPVQPTTATVRTVLGVRGEPGLPDDPARAKVWTSIATNIDAPGYEDEWVSVADLDRDRLARHPWSLSGGGAPEISAALAEVDFSTLGQRATEIGVSAVLGADDAFELSSWSEAESVGLVVGDAVRDFVASAEVRLWPYDDRLAPLESEPVTRWLWRNRRTLENGIYFGQTKEERGLRWFEYAILLRSKLHPPLSITFAFVATHNHFVLDRGGRVFNRSAPVIKLPADASEDDHLALLGVLNSSTACFWLKQNSYPKGGDPVGDSGARVSQQPWSDRYEFTGTTLQDYPLPSVLPTERGRSLDALAQQFAANSPGNVIERATPSRATLDEAHAGFDTARGQMISTQEELDWDCYRLYGLIGDDLTYRGEPPPLALGERAFEIALARRVEAGETDTAWFARHRSTPITDLPSHWPADYQELVQRRLDLIANDRCIALLEQPEHKRRWATEPWEDQEKAALGDWLLDRLEDRALWFDARHRPATQSITVLADKVSRDDTLRDALALWEGRPDIAVQNSLERLLKGEAVPYLAAHRYKESGMRKRAAWERTWALQRREDSGNYNPASTRYGGDGPIPVPPSYVTADFRRSEYWSHRGKLDVPKERFILYPGAGRSGEDVLGWAGWDYAQQALALAQLVLAGQTQDADRDRLVPLIAGLDEVMPWVEQWHGDHDDFYGQSPARYFAAELETFLAENGITREDLYAWRPTTARGRKARA